MQTVTSFPHTVQTIENVFITMADGARLAARIWLPTDAERKPVPAVMEYIPYRKRDVTRARDAENHPYMAGHGYACLRVDIRGSGDSDGVLTDEYTEQELNDAVEVIAWIAAQPWCDGSVGMMGISWGGFNSLQVAARRPPALKAIISACATDDLYTDNMHYMGGCLLGDNLSEATVMFAFNSLPPDPEIVGERWRQMWFRRLDEGGPWLATWLQHQRRQGYWKRASVCEDYAAIQCPVLAVGGWADGFTNAVFRLLQYLDVPRKGLIGPWGHKYPHKGVPGPAIGFLQEAVRWWDHWLKGRDTGIMNEPMLRAWMQDSVPPYTSYGARPGRWVAEPTWPSPRIVMARYRLGPTHIVPGEADRARTQAVTLQSPLSVGLFAGKWCSYAATPDLPGDQREEDGGALVFESHPLDAPLEILGMPEADLDLAADKPVAMVAVRLSDVAPDGKATRVTYGLLNLTHRYGSERPEPLQPNRRYRVRVCLNGIAQSFPAGHRLRVSISSSYWPLAWPPPEPAMLTIMAGGSTLSLPVRPPRREDDHLRPFDAPACAPTAGVTLLEPERHNWRVLRDLAEDVSTLEVTNEHGRFRIEETGTELRRNTWEWYVFQDADFTSVSGETRTQRSLRRGDWRVDVITRTTLTCTTTDFLIHAQLDAYEGKRRVFSGNWDRTIARDHL
ncbi:MAG: CocE/NonD family hydrolase [Aquisalimonadaceae bacterium]